MLTFYPEGVIHGLCNFAWALSHKKKKITAIFVTNIGVKFHKMQNKCKTCERSFESVKELKKHHKEKHQGAIKCVICSEIFAKNSDLETHIKSLHTEKEG